jgi:hypothetical protein
MSEPFEVADALAGEFFDEEGVVCRAERAEGDPVPSRRG